MNQEEFLENLRSALGDVPVGDVDEIVADYKSYFNEALAAGRSTEDVIAAHGDPKRLAQELRVELGLRRWENRKTPANLWKATLALGGLAAADIIILLPALLVLGLITLILFFVFSLFGVIGIGTLLSLMSSSYDPAEGSVASLLLRSIGFLTACIGGGVLLVFALRIIMTQLARYVRLHFKMLRLGSPDAGFSNAEKPGSSA